MTYIYITDLLRELRTGIHTKQITRTYTRIEFASTGAVIISPRGNDVDCLRRYGRIYDLVSQLYRNEARKPGYGQLYVFDSAKQQQNALKINQTNRVRLK